MKKSLIVFKKFNFEKLTFLDKFQKKNKKWINYKIIKSILAKVSIFLQFVTLGLSLLFKHIKLLINEYIHAIFVNSEKYNFRSMFWNIIEFSKPKKWNKRDN